MFSKFKKADLKTDKLKEFASKFNANEFLDKVLKYAKKIGIEITRQALQLYFVLLKEDVPTQDKLLIMGALAYFVATLDIVPDFLLDGFLDDGIGLGYAISKVAQYIDDDVNEKVDEKLVSLFGEA